MRNQTVTLIGRIALTLLLLGLILRVKADPWINEIHYNNTGTDAGEFVEIAGLANANLSGWTLVFYSGQNGTVYKTVSLSGTIPNQSNGHGVIGLRIAGIQNGTPDGIALVNSTGAVVQFLSYDGEFTATAGPASGMTSTNIGVHEPDSTPTSNSLQLAGRGYDYTDFNWQDYTTSTQGVANRGQVFIADKPIVPDPWINEFHYDNTGTDTGEFVEIAGPAGTDLAGWKLLGYSGANGTVYKTVNLSGIITAQSGCTGILSFDLAPIQNGPDGLALVSPSNTVVQFLSYEGRFTATSGLASGLTSVDVRVNETNSTPIGYSLQLIGNSWKYAGFHWTTALNNTRNEINGGQSFNCPPPTAPINLISAIRTDKRVDLQWDNSYTPVTGFKIYRSTDSSNFGLVETVNSNLLTVQQKQLAPNTTYYYKVTAFNSSGESGYSNVTSATTQNTGLLSETWDSVSYPHWPESSYTSSSLGQVLGSDYQWQWALSNMNITSSSFRASGSGWQAGHFESNQTTGSFRLIANTQGIELATSNSLSIGFEAQVDSLGTDANQVMSFEIRNETSYQNSVIIKLDAQSGHPAIAIQANDNGAISNTISSESSLPETGKYWVETELLPNENGLQVSYKLYSKDSIDTPILSGSGILDHKPSLALNTINVSIKNGFVGSIDDISVNASAYESMRMDLASASLIQTGTYTNPITGTDVGQFDPTLIKWQGRYYRYDIRYGGSGFALRVLRSDDLINWYEVSTNARDLLDYTPTQGDRNLLGPEVYYSNGMFYIYLSILTQGEFSKHYLYTSSSPIGISSGPIQNPGPYKFTYTPIGNDEFMVDCIDGNPFIDNDGKCYFVASSVWEYSVNTNENTSITVSYDSYPGLRLFSMDSLTTYSKLLDNHIDMSFLGSTAFNSDLRKSWHDLYVEAPQIMNIMGTYYCFFSGNDYWYDSYEARYTSGYSISELGTNANQSLLKNLDHDLGFTGLGSTHVIQGPNLMDYYCVYNGIDPATSLLVYGDEYSNPGVDVPAIFRRLFVSKMTFSSNYIFPIDPFIENQPIPSRPDWETNLNANWYTGWTSVGTWTNIPRGDPYVYSYTLNNNSTASSVPEMVYNDFEMGLDFASEINVQWRNFNTNSLTDLILAYDETTSTGIHIRFNPGIGSMTVSQMVHGELAILNTFAIGSLIDFSKWHSFVVTKHANAINICIDNAFNYQAYVQREFRGKLAFVNYKADVDFGYMGVTNIYRHNATNTWALYR